MGLRSWFSRLLFFNRSIGSMGVERRCNGMLIAKLATLIHLRNVHRLHSYTSSASLSPLFSRPKRGVGNFDERANEGKYAW